MDTDTMLGLIAIFALLMVLGALRLHRQVKADAAATERYIAEMRQRRIGEARRFPRPGNRIDALWHTPSEARDLPAGVPAPPRYPPPPPDHIARDVNAHRAS